MKVTDLVQFGDERFLSQLYVLLRKENRDANTNEPTSQI